MAVKEESGSIWLKWLVSLLAWLCCATLCLILTVEIEIYPVAYSTLFPAILLILFGNIFIFLFIANRWGFDTKRLIASSLRVCVGEALLLAGLYALARFGFGA